MIYTDNSSVLNRASGISDPMYTQTTRQVAALVTKGSYGGSIEPISSPEYTMTTQHNYGVVGVPMMIDEHNKNGKSRPLSEHVSTVLSGGNHHGFVGIPIMIKKLCFISNEILTFFFAYLKALFIIFSTIL